MSAQAARLRAVGGQSCISSGSLDRLALNVWVQGQGQAGNDVAPDWSVVITQAAEGLFRQRGANRGAQAGSTGRLLTSRSVQVLNIQCRSTLLFTLWFLLPSDDSLLCKCSPFLQRADTIVRFI